MIIKESMAESLLGNAADTKPTNYPHGTKYQEIETAKSYRWDRQGQQWYEQPADGTGAIREDLEQQRRELDLLWKLTHGTVWDTQTDSTAAYTKTVPTGAVAAEIAEIGGKTVILHQLVTGAQGSGGGITVSQEDNLYTYTLDTAGASAFRYVQAGNGIVGHTYLYRITDVTFSSSDIVIRARRNGSFALISKNIGWLIGKATTEDPVGFMVDFRDEGCVAGDTCSLRFQVFDLTEAFGAGNEPDSLEGFRAVFPQDYYAHTDTPQLLSAAVTSVVSKDGEAETLDTFAIPDALRAAYPLHSTRNAADTYDFSNGTYEQNVYKYTFTGNERITSQSETSSILHTEFTPRLSGLPKMRDFGAIYGGDIISVSIPFVTGNGSTVHLCGRYESIRLFTPADFGTGSSTERCKAYLKHLYDEGTPLVIVYPLATPAEHDISSYITDDNMLDVEAGGTLTFVSEAGLAAPNRVDYLIKLSEVEP